MGVLQTSLAKVTCKYFCRSNYKLVSYFFFFLFLLVIEEYFHEKLLEKAFQFLEWYAAM